MESKTRLVNIFGGQERGQAVLCLSVPLTDEIQGFLNGVTETTDLRLKLVKWHEKRSLNANAYFHSLSDKLAEVLNTSKPYMKNQLIRYYSPIPLYEYKTSAPPEYMYEQEIHVRLTRVDIEEYDPNTGLILEEPETKYTYEVLKPTHLMDRKEFNDLLQGAVEDAKAQGIPTKTDSELERLLTEWEERKV